MFQFLGYNLFSDGDALNTAPSLIKNINKIRIENAIFDHFNITKDVNQLFNTTIPTTWNYDTILDADFNGNLNGGNVDFLINQISSVKIKRRKKGEFDWVTLTEIKVNDVDDLMFAFNDRLNAHDVEYDYAFVPILNDVEGNYIINSIKSTLKGVFIGDADSTYKLLYDVSYGSNARNQQIGTFQPLGKKYPVIVANGLLSYESGIVSATVLNDDYEETGKLDRQATVKKKDILKDFLTNRKAKMLRDWNGNLWLCIITDNVQVTYKEGSGMGIPHITFNWTEVGDGENQQDLYINGLIDTLN